MTIVWLIRINVVVMMVVKTFIGLLRVMIIVIIEVIIVVVVSK